MKYPKTYKLVLYLVVSIFIISCNKSPKAKEEVLNNAKKDVKMASDDLTRATKDAINEFNKYKSNIQFKLVENDKIITDLKSKIKDFDKNKQTSYYKQIEKLQIRNTELKLKIENYKQGPSQKWELFKMDFNKELDELGKSISNSAKENMKN